MNSGFDVWLWLAPLWEQQSQLWEACMKEQSIQKLRIALQHGKKIENLKSFFSLHDAIEMAMESTGEQISRIDKKWLVHLAATEME